MGEKEENPENPKNNKTKNNGRVGPCIVYFCQTCHRYFTTNLELWVHKLAHELALPLSTNISCGDAHDCHVKGVDDRHDYDQAHGDPDRHELDHDDNYVYDDDYDYGYGYDSDDCEGEDEKQFEEMEVEEEEEEEAGEEEQRQELVTLDLLREWTPIYAAREAAQAAEAGPTEKVEEEEKADDGLDLELRL